MFEKKEIIYSETMGVCKVTDITKLQSKGIAAESVLYYQLKNVADTAKVAYIPVENHQVLLRPLISKEEAESITEADFEKLTEQQKEEVTYVRNREF